LFQRGDDRWNNHFLGKVQIQDAKEVIWEIVFGRSAWNSHNPAFQGRQPTTGELIAEGATGVWPAPG
jgi:hypothetical protein